MADFYYDTFAAEQRAIRDAVVIHCTAIVEGSRHAACLKVGYLHHDGNPARCSFNNQRYHNLHKRGFWKAARRKNLITGDVHQ